MPASEELAQHESGTGGPRKLSELDDSALLEGLRQSSEAHFTELYDRYFRRIYAFVYSRIRSHPDTEEIVQETFAAAFGSLENFRGQSSLLAWIYGIARNTLNNSLRKKRARTSHLEEYAVKQLTVPTSVTHCSPLDQLEIRRRASAIQDRLKSVASWQSEIFLMRHVEDLSIPEICERTKRSSDSVRSSLYRVKHMIIEAGGLDFPTSSVSDPAGGCS